MMYRVAFVEEYLTAYRKPFFDLLVSQASLHGIEVHVYSGQPQSAQRHRNDTKNADYVIELPQKEYRFLRLRFVIFRTKELMMNNDLIILNQARRNLALYPLLFKSDKPTIALWGHGKDFVKSVSFVSKKLLLWLSKHSHHVFVYTNEGKDYLVRNNFNTDKITVVNNSIDSKTFLTELQSITFSQVQYFKQEYNLTNKTAIYIGGLDFSKQIPFLLDAASQVASKFNDFKLFIVGDGVDRDFVVSFTKTNSWCIYLGRLEGSDKALVFCIANVILNPGRVGLIAVESLVAGKPIITTKIDGHAPEFGYLKENYNCIVSERSIQSYSNKIITYFEDDNLSQSLSAAALDASFEYSIENMVQNFIDGINSLRPGNYGGLSFHRGGTATNEIE